MAEELDQRATADRDSLLLARTTLSDARQLARIKGWKPLGLTATSPEGSVEAQLVRQKKTAIPSQPHTRRSGPGPDERDPQLLAEEIPRLINTNRWGGRTALSDVLAQWPQLVGEELAQHCQPETLQGSVLTVRAHSTAWATQLRLLRTRLLREINTRLQQALATDSTEEVLQLSEVKVLGPTTRSWEHGRLSVAGRGPRDTYG